MLVDGLLATPDSLLYRALSDDDGWSLTDHLLALVHDQLAIANWQRTKDGSKGKRKPRPISPLAKRGQRHGKVDRSPDEVKRYLAQFGPPPS